MSREIKFRVWDKDGKLIGFNRFEKGRWQCQILRAAGGSDEWSNGVLHGPKSISTQTLRIERQGDLRARRTSGRGLWRMPVGEVRYQLAEFALRWHALAEHLNTLVMNHWRLEVIGNI